MNIRPALAALAVVQVFLFCSHSLLAKPPTDHAKRGQFVNKVREIDSIFKNNSISRPIHKDLNVAVQCRVHKMLDYENLVFTQEDFDEFSRLRCYEKLCVGSTVPFSKISERFVLRMKQWRKFVKAKEKEKLNLFSQGNVPRDYVWKSPAKDETALKERWNNFFLAEVIKVSLDRKIDIHKNKELQKVQQFIAAGTVKNIERRIQRTLNLTEEQKLNSLLKARVSCSNRYARIIPKSLIESRGRNAGLVAYPITAGFTAVSVYDGKKKLGAQVTAMIPGSEASETGKIKQRDIIERIRFNGKVYDFTKKATWQQVARSIIPAKAKGKAEFEVFGKRPTEKGFNPFQVKLKFRRTIDSNSLVRSRDMVLGKGAGQRFIRLISIPNFISDDKKLSPKEAISTSSQVYSALARKGSFHALILDLRSNGGGSVLESFRVASQFLPKGQSALTKLIRKIDKTGQQVTDVVRVRDELLPNVPLFVVVNQKTASASELLAQGLKSLKRAVIIGEPTYGKGIQVRYFPLKDGSTVGVVNGVRKGANGRPFHLVGVQPDVYVPSMSGAYPKRKEKQQLVLPEIINRGKAQKNTGKHFVADPKIINELKAFAKRVEDRNLAKYADYLQALRTFREVNSTYPLHYEKAARNDRIFFSTSRQIHRYGGNDATRNFDYWGNLSGLNHQLVLEYIYQMEAQRGRKRRE